MPYIIVTGASGFLARALVDHLSSIYSFIFIARDPSNLPIDASNIALSYSDLEDFDCIKSVSSKSLALIHFGALAHKYSFLDVNGFDYFKSNVRLTFDLSRLQTS